MVYRVALTFVGKGMLNMLILFAFVLPACFQGRFFMKIKMAQFKEPGMVFKRIDRIFSIGEKQSHHIYIIQAAVVLTHQCMALPGIIKNGINFSRMSLFVIYSLQLKIEVPLG